MFLCKRSRTDIDQEISFLSSRAKDANKGYWKKLFRVVIILKGTINNVITLESNDKNNLTWYIDVELLLQAKMNNHTGAVFTIEKGAIISISAKQKLDSRSSTESELIGVYDKISKVLWMKRSLECQSFPVKLNIIYQYNTSGINLEDNGKGSFGKTDRTFLRKVF